MAVVKINAIEVPEGMGDKLEERFAARAGEVENMPGFEGFELLRPTGEEKRYFVYTRWDSEESFQAWVQSSAFTRGHAQAAAAVMTMHDDMPIAMLSKLAGAIRQLAHRQECGLADMGRGVLVRFAAVQQ